MTTSHPEDQLVSRAQPRQRIVLTVLAAAFVAATVMLWMLVSAVRESNALQRQLLATQQAEPAAKPAAKRRPGWSPAREQRSAERAVGDSKPSTTIATKHEHLARFGRQ